jgi:hypothetical protein
MEITLFGMFCDVVVASDELYSVDFIPRFIYRVLLP